MVHFNVSYVRFGDSYPLQDHSATTNSVYIHNLRIASHNQGVASVWIMSSFEAKQLGHALQEAADKLDRIKIVHKVWEIG